MTIVLEDAGPGEARLYFLDRNSVFDVARQAADDLTITAREGQLIWVRHLSGRTFQFRVQKTAARAASLAFRDDPKHFEFERPERRTAARHEAAA